jgi:hypothetical protein
VIYDDRLVPGRLTRLPDDVVRLLRLGRGAFTVGEARRFGITDDRLNRLARAGLLVRLARGAYADAQRYAEADAWDAFAIRSRAFVLACSPPVVASGWSAAAILGLPTISAPPDRPQVLVPRGVRGTDNSRYGNIRRAHVPTEHRVLHRGCPVTTVARTVLDIARTAPRADALVVADSALADGTSRADFQAMLNFQAGWPGITDARWVIQHADGFAESALETLGRLAFLEYDLPLPLSNVWVAVDPLRYRVDHLLADRGIVFEGDGAVKFRGRDAARQVDMMQEREWHLRESGLAVSRYGWKLARHDRAQLAGRFRMVIATAPLRDRPVSWYREVDRRRP